MDTTPTARLVYVGDAMCSWCWGFAPVVERLIASHDLDARLILGGLRPGEAAQPLSDRLKAFLLHHWERVEAVSGQPFDRDALQARDATWMYDTEPAAVAVAAMRRIRPEKEMPYFLAVQRAFYSEGIDITSSSALVAVATRFVDEDAFTRTLADPASRTLAWDDFAEARRLGATGFPTTLLEIDGRLRMLGAGYRSYREIDEILHAALDRHAPAVVGGASCDIDGDC